MMMLFLLVEQQYRVTEQLVQNLPLASKSQWKV